MTSERGKDASNLGKDHRYDTAKEYLEFQNATSWFKHHGENNAPELVYLTLGLVGEAGEFADVVKKITRTSGYFDEQKFLSLMTHPEYAHNLRKEIGDVLWYLNKILAFLGQDLEMVMVTNTYKLYRRLKGRPEFDTLEWPFTNPLYSWEAIHRQFKDIGD